MSGGSLWGVLGVADHEFDCPEALRLSLLCSFDDFKVEPPTLALVLVDCRVKLEKRQ